MEFKELGLNDKLLKAIEDKGFTKPSEIQERTIPLVLEGKDVIAGSKTGSGKTLAFGSGILQNISRGKGIKAIVLCPTRELATQVAAEIMAYTTYDPLIIATVYGGVAINPQIDKLRKADLVVGTPGRILDHLSRRTLDLSKVEILVLDEADIMFDMGFIDDVERIIKRVPKKRQTLLFSATITGPVQNITKTHMTNAVKVNAVAQVDPTKLKQIYYNVSDSQKFSLLAFLIKKKLSGLVMIFTNTRVNTEFIAKNLNKNGVDAVGIHGGLTQARREQIMKEFESGKKYILVCTDVAARGLDIDDVAQVYNYDSPSDPKQYVHRIGRTARAGKKGEAITILSPRDHDNFRKILSDSQINVTKVETPHFPRLMVHRESSRGFRRGGPRNGRRSFGQRRNPRRPRRN